MYVENLMENFFLKKTYIANVDNFKIPLANVLYILIFFSFNPDPLRERPALWRSRSPHFPHLSVHSYDGLHRGSSFKPSKLDYTTVFSLACQDATGANARYFHQLKFPLIVSAWHNIKKQKDEFYPVYLQVLLDQFSDNFLLMEFNVQRESRRMNKLSGHALR